MAYPIKTILVPMQLDDPDATALRVAIRLARESDATICAMHVVPEDFARDLEKAKEDLQRVAGQHLAGVKHQLLTPFSVSGPTEIAAAIIQAAKDGNADLIVMKTHSRHGLAHFILGSVAEQIVRESPCPVLTLTSAAKERFLAP
jgi:nucleotide-binding universal stress UspA family protein